MSNRRFARGPKAWGHCERSGSKTYLKRLVSDGQYPGVMVLRQEYDPKHPQEFVPDMSDPIALERPTSDLDYPLEEVVFPTFTQQLTVLPNPYCVISMGQVTIETS